MIAGEDDNMVDPYDHTLPTYCTLGKVPPR